MKRNRILLLLLLPFIIAGFSSKEIPVRGKGIKFFKGTWEETLLKAEKENKYIFVDVYASWCPPCKKLKRTSFKDDKVGTYYNKNFINVTIDGESREGRKLARKYGVRSYPTLLIVDSNGQKKTKSVGFKTPRILINFGRRIIP